MIVKFIWYVLTWRTNDEFLGYLRSKFGSQSSVLLLELIWHVQLVPEKCTGRGFGVPDALPRRPYSRVYIYCHEFLVVYGRQLLWQGSPFAPDLRTRSRMEPSVHTCNLSHGTYHKWRSEQAGEIDSVYRRLSHQSRLTSDLTLWFPTSVSKSTDFTFVDGFPGLGKSISPLVNTRWN
jgi:hypothetical protein